MPSCSSWLPSRMGITTSASAGHLIRCAAPLHARPAKHPRMPSALPARDDTHLSKERPGLRGWGAGVRVPGAARPRVPKSVLPPRQAPSATSPAFSVHMPATAIVLLKADHKEIRSLFRKFQAPGDKAVEQKSKIVEQITELLTVHAYIENEVMYPEVCAAPQPQGRHAAFAGILRHVFKLIAVILPACPATCRELSSSARSPPPAAVGCSGTLLPGCLLRRAG
jgi:hypothetical protein